MQQTSFGMIREDNDKGLPRPNCTSGKTEGQLSGYIPKYHASTSSRVSCSRKSSITVINANICQVEWELKSREQLMLVRLRSVICRLKVRLTIGLSENGNQKVLNYL